MGSQNRWKPRRNRKLRRNRSRCRRITDDMIIEVICLPPPPPIPITRDMMFNIKAIN